MAYAMTKQGSLDNCITYEFICDTTQDMNAIENGYRTIGTVAIVLSGADEGLEVYMSGSDHEWVSLSSMGTSGGGATGGLSIYICAQNEVSNGLPNIQDPDETTIYLVASGNESGNLYEEYIYVNDAWEKFGSGGATIDLSAYAPKASPVFTGSISMGRIQNSVIGQNSFAVGNSVTASSAGAHAEGTSTAASGDNSHAEGGGTTASSAQSHAEGSGSQATNSSAHAEGQGSRASGVGSHAEGGGTAASGNSSHAEGSGTTASGDYSHAEGGGTIASGSDAHAEGNMTIASGSHSHAEGLDTNANHKSQHVFGEYNISDTSSAQATERGTYVEIVGNGTIGNARSNARALDWDGNEHLKGDVYVNCNADSTGGTKLIGLPTPPVSDGTYTLQLTITSGVPAYSWVALSSLSGVTF